MRNYAIRRLLLIVPTLFLVTLIIFGFIRMVPGNAVDFIVERSQYITQADRDQIMHQLGLDLPVYEQYGKWIGDIILHGDFGDSLLRGTPVIESILLRLPISMELGLLGIIVSLLISLPIGIYSAMRQDSFRDYIGRSIGIGLVAVPNFWVATMVVVFPALWWNWSPPLRYTPFLENPVENLVQFLVPAVILGMQLSGGTMRMIRTMMLEVLRQDYIRTAWSKGLREKTVVARHALKNALIPVVTIIGYQAPVMISGSVILEQIFSLPGLGLLFIEALTNRDYTVISGINLFVATGILFINLVVDLAYAWLDPRVRYS